MMNLHVHLTDSDTGVRLTAGETYQDSRHLLDGDITPRKARELARFCDDLIGYDGDAPGPMEKKLVKQMRERAWSSCTRRSARRSPMADLKAHVCECGHTAHWHGAGDRCNPVVTSGQGKCESCSCRRFRLHHTDTLDSLRAEIARRFTLEEVAQIVDEVDRERSGGEPDEGRLQQFRSESADAIERLGQR